MADHFPLLSLDDGLLGQVLGCLPAQSVASTALSCSRLRDAARHSTAWQTACLPFLGTPQAPATAVQSAISRLGHRRVAKHLRLADAACWREVPVSGPSPPIREGCSLSTLDSGQLVVFGGHWGNDTFYNDIWMLETSASQPQWREVLVAQHPVPSPRALHFAAVMQGSVLLIHGGLLPEGYRYNDTWRIDLASDSPSWQEIGLADGGAQEAHSLLVADVSRPVPRFHHTIALVGDQLVVFGGHNYRREEMNDTWALDVGNPGKPTWRRLPGRPFQRPCKRAFQVCGVLPPASPRQHPQLVIHGGLAADEATLSDTWVLDLGTEDWRPVDVGVSSEPEERERHAACVIQPAGGRAHLLVCGGIGGSAAHTCKGLFMAQRRLLPVQPFLLSLSHWQGHRLASGQVPGIQCESGNDDGHEAAFHLGRIRAILGLQDGLEGTSSGDLETPSPHPTQYASPDEDASELVAVDGCWTGLPFAESVAVREAPAAQNGAALLQRSRSLPEPITQAGLLDPRLMRREAVCLPLRSGHVVLFGGNDGRWTDAFGDGDHRFGMADTLVMDLSPLADTAHPKSRGFRSTDDSELNDGPMAEHDHVPLATGHPIGYEPLPTSEPQTLHLKPQPGPPTGLPNSPSPSTSQHDDPDPESDQASLQQTAANRRNASFGFQAAPARQPVSPFAAAAEWADPQAPAIEHLRDTSLAAISQAPDVDDVCEAAAVMQLSIDSSHTQSTGARREASSTRPPHAAEHPSAGFAQPAAGFGAQAGSGRQASAAAQPAARYAHQAAANGAQTSNGCHAAAAEQRYASSAHRASANVASDGPEKQGGPSGLAALHSGRSTNGQQQAGPSGLAALPCGDSANGQQQAGSGGLAALNTGPDASTTEGQRQAGPSGLAELNSGCSGSTADGRWHAEFPGSAASNGALMELNASSPAPGVGPSTAAVLGAHAPASCHRPLDHASIAQLEPSASGSAGGLANSRSAAAASAQPRPSGNGGAALPVCVPSADDSSAQARTSGNGVANLPVCVPSADDYLRTAALKASAAAVRCSDSLAAPNPTFQAGPLPEPMQAETSAAVRQPQSSPAANIATFAGGHAHQPLATIVAASVFGHYGPPPETTAGPGLPAPGFAPPRQPPAQQGVRLDLPMASNPPPAGAQPAKFGWVAAGRGAPESTSSGCGVAVIQPRCEVVVVDQKGDSMRVHVLSLLPD